MTLANDLYAASFSYQGALARMPAPPAPDVDRLRAQALYRVTLTADLLDRCEVGELASWAEGAAIRIIPGTDGCGKPLVSGLAFDFEQAEDAAAFLRNELVPRFLEGDFDTVLAGTAEVVEDEDADEDEAADAPYVEPPISVAARTPKAPRLPRLRRVSPPLSLAAE